MNVESYKTARQWAIERRMAENIAKQLDELPRLPANTARPKNHIDALIARIRRLNDPLRAML